MHFNLKRKLGGSDGGPPLPEYTALVLRTECFPGRTDAEIDDMDAYDVLAALICRNAKTQSDDERSASVLEMLAKVGIRL